MCNRVTGSYISCACVSVPWTWSWKEASCLGLAVFRAIWFESIGRIRHGHGNGIGRFTNSDRKDIEELVSELRNGGYLGFAVPYSGIGYAYGYAMAMAMLAMLHESKTGCAFGFAVYALRAHPRYLAYYIYRLCLGLVIVGWGQLGIWFWLGSERVRWAIFEQVRPSETCPEASQATVTHCQSTNHRLFHAVCTLMKHA